MLSHTLTDRISLAYNLGMDWDSEENVDDGGRNTLSVFQYTIATAFGITDKFGVYTELFGDVAMSAGGGPAHSFSGGLTYLVKDNLQLDTFSGVGISEDADDWFAGAGISYRFPRQVKHT